MHRSGGMCKHRACSIECLRQACVLVQVRLLRKEAFIKGKPVPMRGIGLYCELVCTYPALLFPTKPTLWFVVCLGPGDVCTHPSFQRQGAAGAILNDIMRYLGTGLPPEEEAPRAVCALHAMASMRPFYAKFGFVSVPVHRATVQVPMSDLCTFFEWRGLLQIAHCSDYAYLQCCTTESSECEGLALPRDSHETALGGFARAVYAPHF